MLKILIPWIIILMIVLPPIAGVVVVVNMIHPRNTIEQPEVPPVVAPPVVKPPVVVTPSVTPPVVTPDKPVGKATYVQLGSYKSEVIARKGLQQLAQLKSKLYNVLDVRVYKATLPNGIWYRLALKVADLKTGNALCAKLKDVDQGCLVLQF